MRKKKLKALFIIYYEYDHDQGFDKDSLSITNHKNFKKIDLTLYHDELASDPNVDYYIVGMDVPLFELVDVEERDEQIMLFWSKFCNFNSTHKTRIITLSISSEKAREEIYMAFNQLLNLRNVKHIRLHEFNQCILEKL
jgi:hypothetical protein